MALPRTCHGLYLRYVVFYGILYLSRKVQATDHLLRNIHTNDQTKQVQYDVVDDVKAHQLIGTIPSSNDFENKQKGDDVEKIQYTIISENQADSFKINSSTGELWTAKKLDRDELCPSQESCSISLEIMLSPGKYFKLIKVVILIKDLNDNSPAFPQVRKHIAIPESSAPGTTFALPIASDKDSPKNGIQTYRLMAAPDLFNLKTTRDADKETMLKLVLNSKLDREKVSNFQLQLIAIDGGTPQRTGTLLINVTVSDINDNSPKFNDSVYLAVVPENQKVGSVVATVFATDADAGQNGEIVYGFDISTRKDRGNLFGIDSATGKIYLRDHLDYETHDVHNLIVEARDKGSTPLTDTTKVKIQVTDVNDHPPLIKLHTVNPGSGVATIAENQEVGFLAHVAVTDPDGGDNGKFTCNLEDRFFIMRPMSYPENGEYEILSKEVLDRERKSSYNLTIHCQDSGNPPLSSVMLVPVKVTDQNDNEPVFINAPYVASICENNYVGERITQVTAKDIDEGRNGKVTYHIDKDFEDTLTVDRHTGLITAKSVFDYEQTNIYRFRIEARDNGTESKTAVTEVTLSVTDTNDEPPKFKLQKYAFGVKENQPPGTSVDTVHADDKDSDPFNKFVYSLDPRSKASDSFRLDKTTGRMTTKKVLDREEQSSYHLIAIATDNGQPPLSSTASVIVYVGDTNDNSPIIDFPNKYNFTVEVPSKIPVGHCITKIQAHDDDSGVNSKLAFYLKQTTGSEYFSLQQWTGELMLDRQVRVSGKKTYHLHVEVRDEGPDSLRSSEQLLVVFDDSLEYIPSHQPARSVPFSPRNLLLLTCVAAFALVVIFILLTVLVCLRRRNRGYRPPDKYRVTAGSEYPVYANIRGCGTLNRPGDDPLILTDESLKRKVSLTPRSQRYPRPKPIERPPPNVCNTPPTKHGCPMDKTQEMERLVQSAGQWGAPDYSTTQNADAEFHWKQAASQRNPATVPEPAELPESAVVYDYDSRHATMDTGYSSPGLTPISHKPNHIMLRQSDLLPPRVNHGKYMRPPSCHMYSQHPVETMGSDTSYENAPRGWRPTSGGVDTSDENHSKDDREMMLRENSFDSDELSDSISSESPRMLSVMSCDV